MNWTDLSYYTLTGLDFRPPPQTSRAQWTLPDDCDPRAPAPQAPHADLRRASHPRTCRSSSRATWLMPSARRLRRQCTQRSLSWPSRCAPMMALCTCPILWCCTCCAKASSILTRSGCCERSLSCSTWMPRGCSPWRRRRALSSPPRQQHRRYIGMDPVSRVSPAGQQRERVALAGVSQLLWLWRVL